MIPFIPPKIENLNGNISSIAALLIGLGALFMGIALGFIVGRYSKW